MAQTPTSPDETTGSSFEHGGTHDNGAILAQQFTSLLAARGAAATASAREMDALADSLLRDAVNERASDIHIEPMDGSTRVRFRIDGELLDAALLPRTHGGRLLNHFKAIGDIDPGHVFRPQQTRLTYTLDDRDLDLRLAVAPCLDSEVLVIRLLRPELLEQRLSALGLRDHDLQRLHEWLKSTSGMLLACGPTGSGKTTTIYSIIRELSQLHRSIFTIEDPVEYEVAGINQIPVDEDHQLNFAEGLKAILRMDPDYIMLGEIRDGESAEAGLTAANRGTVVLSTMHSRDPVGVVTTFRNWHLPDNEIAVGLNMLIAQRLVRRLCPECCYEDKPTDEQKRWLRAAGVKPPQRIWQAGACEHCHGQGYRGRTGIFDIWQLDEEDYEAILGGMDEHALRRQVHEKDPDTMLDDGLDKAKQGIISIDALRHVPDLLPLRALNEHTRKQASNSQGNSKRKKKRTTKSTSKRRSGKSANNGGTSR
ncbi:MAG: GspE/PulE family protein [Phycisphaeraceae bacterium]